MWMFNFKSVALLSTMAVATVNRILMNAGTTVSLDNFKTWLFDIFKTGVVIVAAGLLIKQLKDKSVMKIVGILAAAGFIWYFLINPEQVLGALGTIMSLFFSAATE